MPSATPAPLWLRLAAALYDLFPLIGLWMLTVALAMLVVHGDVDVAHPSSLSRNALRVALLAVTAGYFVLSWVRGGQTIGMRAWRLRVVSADGAPLRWPRALLRFALALVSLLAFGLGFFWCLFERERRGWHDLGSRSAVVRLAD
ncbi:MAG: RDD family protein [Dokdonella sp.]|uniref:RDD family protein n=1 Tax=Dokdonella sp. TaxID=2291710 RepID=UPI003F7E5666